MKNYIVLYKKERCLGTFRSKEYQRAKTQVLSAEQLLTINYFGLDLYEQKEIVGLGLNIASGKSKENEIKVWIEKHRK